MKTPALLLLLALLSGCVTSRAPKMTGETAVVESMIPVAVSLAASVRASVSVHDLAYLSLTDRQIDHLLAHVRKNQHRGRYLDEVWDCDDISREFRVLAADWTVRSFHPPPPAAVAVATVLFPRLSRLATRGDLTGFRETVALGLGQIGFLLLPASAVGAALSVPIVRLLYERGAFTPDQTTVVAGALAAFTLGLTFNGTMLMLTRAFFSLQSPWVPTAIALGNLGVNAALDAAFYRFGVWGIPFSTSLVNIAGTAVLLLLFRRRLGRVDGDTLLDSYARIVLASALAAGVAFGAWYGLDQLLGRSLGAQVVTVGAGLAGAVGVYLLCARALRIPELRAVLSLVRRSGTTGE